MEERLKSLIEANNEQNRAKRAQEWKHLGKKAIGILCSYVPEEIIHAAGLLPFRVSGTWRTNVSFARAYRPVNTDVYYTHVLEALMSGDLDFLDGVITSNRDDDMRRLYDAFAHLGRLPFYHMIHVPHQKTELAFETFARVLASLKSQLEESFGVNISDDSLRESIDIYDRWRMALLKIYGMRKRPMPPLTGAEALGIVTASFVMRKDEHIRELESLLPYLEQRRAFDSNSLPRLLVSADVLDNPAYLNLIEEAGAIVAMDDMDTGSRYFWQTVDNDIDDPFHALAKRYISRPADPRMYFWNEQIDQVIRWVSEWKIDAVVNFPHMYTYPRLYGTPYFRDRMAEAGIPFITIEREYCLANVGQLQTRIGAFLEMI